MTEIAVITDVHGEESKLERLVDIAKSSDLVITCGDDFDKKEEHGYEVNRVLVELIHEHGPKDGLVNELSEDEQKKIVQNVQQGFFDYFAKKAMAINQRYKATGKPVVGTLGNHDPIFAKKLDGVKYLVGEKAKFKDLVIGGLPATYEFVSEPVFNFCGGFYEHLGQCSDTEVSDLAKKLLEGPEVDIFITHKAPHKESEAIGTNYGVDAGAKAIVEAHKPKLCVFGHVHSAEAEIVKGKNGTVYVHPGLNGVVKVTLNGKNPEGWDYVPF